MNILEGILHDVKCWPMSHCCLGKQTANAQLNLELEPYLLIKARAKLMTLLKMDIMCPLSSFRMSYNQHLCKCPPIPPLQGNLKHRRKQVICSSETHSLPSHELSRNGRRQAMFQIVSLFSTLPFTVPAADAAEIDWVKGEGVADGQRTVTAFYPENNAVSNVNVIITGLGADFTKMESFGTVDAFGETLVNSLDRSWQRPPGQAAKLLNTKSKNGMYYVEYSFQKPGESSLHIFSVIGMAFNGWYNRLYTVTGQAGFVLCGKCFEDGNYGLGMSAADFKQIDLHQETSQLGGDRWTDQEILLLLEATLLHGDDWKRVAQHVGSKNESDCVMKLIQLPFGEQFMVNVQNEGSDRRSTNVKSENKVAFLSTMVGPGIAAAAAQAAVAALYEEDSSASQITSTEEANFAGGKNCTTASGLEGTRKDFELEASNKEITRGANENAKDDEPLPNGKDMDPATPEMRSATATALGAAAVHARLLADQEDRDIEHIFSTIVDTQMKKLHDKIQHFEELELIMEKERSQVEQIKELLFADWVRFIQQSMNSGFSGSQQKE